MTKQTITFKRTETLVLELSVPERLSRATLEVWANAQQLGGLSSPAPGQTISRVVTDWAAAGAKEGFNGEAASRQFSSKKRTR